MKYLTFGIEIEITGITRQRAAEVIAKELVGIEKHVGGAYDAWEIKASPEKVWKVVNDSSLKPERKERGRLIEAGENYRVEVVSPICSYEDIEKLQRIVRALRKAGAFPNTSCGIHIHIGKEKFTAKTLRNLVNIMASKEDLIYKALKVGEQREGRYCKKVNKKFLEKLNKIKPMAMEGLEDLWYEGWGRDRRTHYHPSRYHGLNLHPTFQGSTVEFRLFNSTTHAGKVKAYIQFCMAISHQALTQKSASAKKTETTNDKYTFRTWLLRLGLIGDEFQTARLHLLADLEGDIAFRNGRRAVVE